LSINDLGSRTTSFYEGLWDIQDDLEAKFGSLESIPDYELIDEDETIAVIYLQGFTIDSPDDFKSIVRSLPNSVENVVIDLAYNTGGNIGAVFRIFGYMTEETFKYHSQNPADNSKVTYYIESDYNAYDEYNWYIKTSSVTFSAANLMTSIAKEQGIATIVGQKSSGGASSIGAVITPDGSTMLISTNNVLSTKSGTRYYSIENGITPNITMSNVYSDSELIQIITEDQAEE
jgi:C-terminal processing protease CtpA/Prc